VAPNVAMRDELPLPEVDPARGAAVLALALVAFTALAHDLLVHGPITSADMGFSIWMHERVHPWLTRFMAAVSYVHKPLGVCAMAAVAGIVLACRRQPAWLWMLLACVPVGLMLNDIAKLAFHRSRPVFESGAPALSSFGFPSGHTAGAMVWWGFALAFWLACEPRAPWRAAGIVVAASLVVLVAVSRVYLGFHFASDVLAAIAEGAAWLALCFTVASAWSGGRAPSGAGA
jgi:membrane-associated phospholipid phosphatase